MGLSPSRGGEGPWDSKAHALDSKCGTNAIGISSAWRSGASIVKVDAPSVTKRVPALAGPGVVSPAMRFLTKTVEKHCPLDAYRSHQSATSLVF